MSLPRRRDGYNELDDADFVLAELEELEGFYRSRGPEWEDVADRTHEAVERERARVARLEAGLGPAPEGTGNPDADGGQEPTGG